MKVIRVLLLLLVLSSVVLQPSFVNSNGCEGSIIINDIYQSVSENRHLLSLDLIIEYRSDIHNSFVEVWNNTVKVEGVDAGVGFEGDVSGGSTLVNMYFNDDGEVNDTNVFNFGWSNTTYIVRWRYTPSPFNKDYFIQFSTDGLDRITCGEAITTQIITESWTANEKTLTRFIVEVSNVTVAPDDDSNFPYYVVLGLFGVVAPALAVYFMRRAPKQVIKKVTSGACRSCGAKVLADDDDYCVMCGAWL